MINNRVDFDLVEIKKFYDDAFRLLGKSTQPPEITIRLYPYVNVNHTIRARDGKILVRISNLFEHAPLEAHRSLAFILVAKLLNKKVPTKAREIYRRFVNEAEFQSLALENKRKKSRKIIGSSIGVNFNLENLFGKLNVVYFNNEIPKPTLTWSQHKTYRRLGHYDPAHNLITISKSLDDKRVPKFLVEYIVYHEMLHIKHPTQHRNGRRYNHTPTFKRDEEKFSYFEEAEDWIEQNAGWLKRQSRK